MRSSPRLRDQMRCGWISRDGKLIIAVRGVRTFVHSAASVLLAIYLDLLGFSLFEIGLFLTILWLAARLARRVGLVNAMVFTHIPSSLLIAIPFRPDARLAVLFWLVRAFFVQMDAPTSQSYTMAVVGPQERSAMAAATALWGAASASAPFVIGGVVKIAYDLILWLLFRHVKPPEKALRHNSNPPAVVDHARATSWRAPPLRSRREPGEDRLRRIRQNCLTTGPQFDIERPRVKEDTMDLRTSLVMTLGVGGAEDRQLKREVPADTHHACGRCGHVQRSVAARDHAPPHGARSIRTAPATALTALALVRPPVTTRPAG
jgi:hypothetical protein